MTSIELPDARPATLESASVVGRRLAALLAAVIVGLARVIVPHLFTVAGLAAFTIGAFTAGRTTGFVVLGCSLLLLEYKIREGSHGADRR